MNLLLRPFVRLARRRERAAETRIQTVSHDLRAPINATEGYLRYLMEGECGELNAEQGEIVSSAIESLCFMRRFIDEMLDLAKIEAGAMTYAMEETHLGETLRAAAELFKFALREKGLAFSLRVQPGLPPARMDKDRIRQVLSNLLSNAVKFTPCGGRITLSAQANSRRVLVSVADTGIGIPDGQLRALFARFSRVEVERSAAEKAEGTGLGLWIARGIVRGHDGDLWVDSKFGVGSTFQFTLPAGKGDKE